MKSSATLGHILSIITILIWGTTFVSTKVILRDLSPVEILFYRFVIGYAALLVMYPRIEKPRRLKEEALFFLLGLTGISLYFLTENIALNWTNASNVGLIVAIAPILTTLLANYFEKNEKFRIESVIGFITAFTGIFLVIFNGRMSFRINPLGDFFALLSALVWSIYSILLRKVDKSINPIYAVRKSFFYGLLTVMPMLFIFGADLKSDNPVSPALVLNIAFLGLAASALCFVMWNTAAKIIGIVKTSNYIYLVPLITMITSLLVLHEIISMFTLSGGVLILSGVYICEKGLNLPIQLSLFSKGEENKI